MPRDLSAEACSARTERRETPETAFVIDDEPLMAKVLERHLTRRGIEAVLFDDPHVLLDSLRSAPPAFLFTDLEMPRMRGGALIGRAREAGFGGTIVLVTASREQEALAAAVAGGADEVLGKPVKEFDLDLALAKGRSRKRLAAPALEALRAAIEPVAQGIILVDEEGVPIDANRRAREALGAESVSDVAAALERSGLAGEIMKSRPEGGEIAFVDLSTSEGGGASLPVGFEVHRIECAAAGGVRLVLLHDFSEWRKLDELHSRFVTFLSHRMRTPLTSARNAVSILGSRERTLEAAEKERFVDIGCRNLETLASSFDELQRIFMIESDEIASCRSLVRVGKELQTILRDRETAGTIEGFRLRAPDCTVLTCHGRFKEYVTRAIDAIALWSGGTPYIECVAAVSDAVDENGAGEPVLTLTVIPRGRTRGDGTGLRNFFRLREVQKEIILDKLARALDGTHETTERNTMRLAIPVQPVFDRQRDLVHPLHLMIEKADLEKAEFHLLSVRMAGARPVARRCERFVAASLCGAFPRNEALVSRGEEPSSFAVFAAGVARERVQEAMEGIRDRFARFCRETGEEIYPAIRWEITYSREPGSARGGETCSLLDFSAKP